MTLVFASKIELRADMSCQPDFFYCTMSLSSIAVEADVEPHLFVAVTVSVLVAVGLYPMIATLGAAPLLKGGSAVHAYETPLTARIPILYVFPIVALNSAGFPVDALGIEHGPGGVGGGVGPGVGVGVGSGDGDGDAETLK